MNEHLLSDQHKATMSDNSVPELKEKMKKQQDAFKQRVRNAQKQKKKSEMDMDKKVATS